MNEEKGKNIFLGYILLKDANIDLKKLEKTVAKAAKIKFEKSADKGILVGKGKKSIISLILIPHPFPYKEDFTKIEPSFPWEESGKAYGQQCAHLVVSATSQDEPVLLLANTFIKAVCAALKQPGAVAFHMNGWLYNVAEYIKLAQNALAKKQIPILNLIFFGLYSNGDKTGGAYTRGLAAFGKKEMEILKTIKTKMQVFEFLYDMVSYVVGNNITLRDGETIGFTAEDKNKITESVGVMFPEENTLKIDIGE